MRERALIERLLAPLATHPAARGLVSDTAVLSPPLGRDLVLTHDVLAAGVHYLPGDPPSDVAWKLLAVNLSDLAASGARPLGVLMGLGLSAAEDEAWLTAFSDGLRRAMERWGVALFGGDTVRGLDRAVLGLTAIGQVEPGRAMARTGARAGDDLWVTGTIGDAGLGLAIARGERTGDSALVRRYRRPEPRLAFGQALVGVASAALDVSDGLLLDASRLAAASGVRIELDLRLLPLSPQAAGMTGPADLLDRASAGDDYELLFAAPQDRADDIVSISQRTRLRVTRIGRAGDGGGLRVMGPSGDEVTPARLGFEH